MLATVCCAVSRSPPEGELVHAQLSLGEARDAGQEHVGAGRVAAGVGRHVGVEAARVDVVCEQQAAGHVAARAREHQDLGVGAPDHRRLEVERGLHRDLAGEDQHLGRVVDEHELADALGAGQGRRRGGGEAGESEQDLLHGWTPQICPQG